MSPLRDEVPDGVLCTLSTRTSATAAGFSRSSKLSSFRIGQAVRSVRVGGMDRPSRHKSHPVGLLYTSRKAGLRVGSSIYPSALLVQTLAIFVLVVTLCCLLCIFPRLSETNSENRILIYSNENKNASLQSFFQCPWIKKENSKCNFPLKYC